MTYDFSFSSFSTDSRPIALANDMLYVEVYTEDRKLSRVYDLEFTYTVVN